MRVQVCPTVTQNDGLRACVPVLPTASGLCINKGVALAAGASSNAVSGGGVILTGIGAFTGLLSVLAGVACYKSMSNRAGEKNCLEPRFISLGGSSSGSTVFPQQQAARGARDDQEIDYASYGQDLHQLQAAHWARQEQGAAPVSGAVMER